MTQKISSVTLTPADAVTNGISTSQKPAGGGAQNLTITGSLAAGGVANLVQARRVGITSDGADAARTFTITGTDRQGQALSETLAGPGAGLTVVSLYDYMTVTKVQVDANTAGNITVGTAKVAAANTPGVISSQWIPLDHHNTTKIGFEVVVTGVVNYSVEHARESMYGRGFGVQPPGGVTALKAKAFQHGSIDQKSADNQGDYDPGITAIRLTINSYTFGATAELRVVPAGAGGQGFGH